ncbi:Hypothetical predicted protein [Mytilus galloprovincialis]|uniref:Uncharacterized protein n=1 Tax=Mytilus galloprovincialis TaxID=29158 RepID=A0A8B6FA60_MYTGA|nr:Hypothetical predicted protein [Mytilus galloprovincialis]
MKFFSTGICQTCRKKHSERIKVDEIQDPDAQNCVLDDNTSTGDDQPVTYKGFKETIESYKFEEQQSTTTPDKILMMENPAEMLGLFTVTIEIDKGFFIKMYV